MGLAYLRKSDGSPAVKLGAWSAPVLSPDGTRVLVSEASVVGQGIYLALLPTGVGETQTLKSTGLQQVGPKGFMPDGKSIYFAADDGHGWRMYIQDLVGGMPRTITPVISGRPSHFETQLASPDGKFIFAPEHRRKGQPLSRRRRRTEDSPRLVTARFLDHLVSRRAFGLRVSRRKNVSARLQTGFSNRKTRTCDYARAERSGWRNGSLKRPHDSRRRKPMPTPTISNSPTSS